MALVADWNLAAVQVTLGSFRVTGFGETDACTIVPLADLMQSAVSADGANVARSRINDPRHEVTLTVKRGTLAYRRLAEAMQDQIVESDSGAVSPLAFRVYDPISGDEISDSRARFKRRPDMAFNQAQADAVFVIELARPAITHGQLIE